MGFCSILLLSNILLTAWLSTAKGEVKPCGFPQFKYGRLYYEESRRPYFPVSIGKEYSYYCDNGFSTPSGSYWDYLHCTAQGWEPEIPCLRQCVFHYVENGESAYWERKYMQGQSVKVSCYRGFSLADGQDKMTCTETGWSPPPRCFRIKTCSVSDIEIENGFFSESDFKYALNRKTWYRCKQGYVTSTGETSGSITCLQNGWSSQPSCIKSCDVPVFENAVTKNNSSWFILNDKLDYECHVGYENAYKQTKGYITCTYYGWSDIPSCYERECTIPILDPHLVVYPKKEKYKVGDLLKFSCRSGHRVGPDSVQCYNFGWFPSFPTCKDNSCVDPPHVPNAAIVTRSKTKYLSGDRVRYECNKPFELFGEVEVMCQNGIWTEPPKCRDSTGICGPPPPIDNGDITSLSKPAYAPFSSLEYQCQKYYLLKGEKTIICRHGKWSKPPTCLRACVVQEEIMEKHNIILRWRESKKAYTQSEENIEFRCKPRYREALGSSPFRTKCINGHINYPTCV